MGFGAVAANMLMFIAVIMIAGGFVVLINSYAQETTVSMQLQKDRLMEELRTDVTITAVSYNDTIPRVWVYVLNTGKTTLNAERSDLYIDGVRVDRTERVLTIESDTELSDLPVWEPQEIIRIAVDTSLSSGPHRFRIVTSNGISHDVVEMID